MSFVIYVLYLMLAFGFDFVGFSLCLNTSNMFNIVAEIQQAQRNMPRNMLHSSKQIKTRKITRMKTLLLTFSDLV